MQTQYNILITEDHTLTRFAIKTTLKDVNFVANVYEADNYTATQKILNENHVDLILMDLGLPDIDGIEITKRIKKEYPDIKIIVLTSHVNEEDVINSLRAGANSYCCKDIEPEDLIKVIESTIKGASWFDAKVSSYVLNFAAKSEPSDNIKQINQNYNLTARETEILKLMSEGLNNFQIAGNLNLSVNTIKSHVCSILQKLSVDDRVQAVIIALKNKIV